MHSKYVIKNIHRKLLNAGVLIAPYFNNNSNLVITYSNFNYKNISFIDFTKYSLQFYEILRFLLLARKLALKVIYIYSEETQVTKKLQNIAKVTDSFYFVGKWVDGFFTNKLFLTTRNLFTKTNENKFFCPKKPHIAIVFSSKNSDRILIELHKAGIVTILVGSGVSQKCRPSYYLPGRDLNIKNYLFYFTVFLTFLNPKFPTKIDCVNYLKLFYN